MIRGIGALNQEMDAAGTRFFAGGLESASHAKSLRKQPDGNVSITDGPYLEAKEYIGGFWILECADMDEALAWGRKATIACRVPKALQEAGVLLALDGLFPPSTGARISCMDGKPTVTDGPFAESKEVIGGC